MTQAITTEWLKSSGCKIVHGATFDCKWQWAEDVDGVTVALNFDGTGWHRYNQTYKPVFRVKATSRPSQRE